MCPHQQSRGHSIYHLPHMHTGKAASKHSSEPQPLSHQQNHKKQWQARTQESIGKQPAPIPIRALLAQVRTSSWSEPANCVGIPGEPQEDKQERPDTLSHPFITPSVAAPGCPAGPLAGSSSCPAQPWGGGEQKGFTGSCLGAHSRSTQSRQGCSACIKL